MSKKGVAATIESIIIIIIILFFLLIMLALVNKSAKKEVEINTQALELSALSNTFYLVNRSLYMTWYVSTVQALFTAGFDGLGCGPLIHPGSKQIIMKEGYWYKTDPTKNPSDESEIRFPIIFPSKIRVGDKFSIETYYSNGAAERRYAILSCTIDGNPLYSGCVEIPAGGTVKLVIEVDTNTYAGGIVSSCSINKYTDSCADANLIIQGEPEVLNEPFSVSVDTKQEPLWKYRREG
ncbi:MAG: hypothetical protein QMD85_03175, partial [Candidatus Aenigmarchaeota archaeon]|nr:hypothetical protein [Candidatus Aenigmarchaeota archaeon]MDI6722539.1 hypothetical protein [Candidatus Aenigmarchaeota archaeon]